MRTHLYVCVSLLKTKTEGGENMRRMIALIVVLVLIVISSVGLAFFMIQLNRAGVLLSGKVSEIEKFPQNSLVTLNTPKGQIFRFSSTNQKLGGIKIGDRVAVRDVNGWAAYPISRRQI
jgi:hypothetical protein